MPPRLPPEQGDDGCHTNSNHSEKKRNKRREHPEDEEAPCYSERDLRKLVGYVARKGAEQHEEAMKLLLKVLDEGGSSGSEKKMRRLEEEALGQTSDELARSAICRIYAILHKRRRSRRAAKSLQERLASSEKQVAAADAQGRLEADSLLKKLQKCKERNKELCEKYECATKQLEESKGEVVMLRAQVQTCKSEEEILQGRMEELQQMQLQQQQQQLCDSGRVDALQAQVEQLQRENAELKAARQFAVDVAEDARSKLHLEKERAESVQKQLEEACKREQEAAGQLKILQSSAGGSDAEHAKELAGMVRRYETANALYEREKERCEAMARRAQEEGSQLLQQVQLLERDNRRLQDEVRRKEQQLLLHLQ